MLITACSDDLSYDTVNISSADESQVVISASVASTTTRTNPAGSDDTGFNAGDTIAVGYDSLSFTGYYYDGAEWKVKVENDYLTWYSDSVTNYHFYAYYPMRDGPFYTLLYNGSSNIYSTLDSVSYYHFSIPTVQNTVDGIAKADYMKCDTIVEEVPDDKTLGLTFHRQMALVKLSITAVDYIGTSNSVKVDSVQIYSPYGKWVYNTPYGDVTPVWAYSDGDYWYGIVIPTDEAMVDSTFLAIYMSDTYNSKETRNTVSTCTNIPQMKAGKRYTISVTAYWDRVEINNITVADWTEKTGLTAVRNPSRTKNMWYDLTADTTGTGLYYSSLSLFLQSIAGDDLDNQTISLAGELSADDMDTLDTYLSEVDGFTDVSITLDLSEITNDEIPASTAGTYGITDSQNMSTFTDVASLAARTRTTTATNGLVKLVMPGRDYKIADGAFAEYTSLREVENSEYATKIGKYCFYGCTALEEANFTNVDTVSEGAFAKCTGLESVTFTNATAIGKYALYNTTSLDSLPELSIPKVLTIGRCAFVGSAVSYVNLNAVTDVEAGAFSGLNSSTANNLTELVIGPTGEIVIGDSAFIRRPYLNQVSADTITKITLKKAAFQECSLNEHNNTFRMDGLVEAGDSAFWGSTHLNPNFPRLRTAGNYCFYNCTYMKSPTFDSLRTAGNYCFYYVGVGYSTTGGDSISIPNCTYMGDSCAYSSAMGKIAIGELTDAGTDAIWSLYLSVIDLTSCSAIPAIRTTTFGNSTCYAAMASDSITIKVSTEELKEELDSILTTDSTVTSEASMYNWYTYFGTSPVSSYVKTVVSSGDKESEEAE